MTPLEILEQVCLDDYEEIMGWAIKRGLEPEN
jgi:hypothetical protein